MITKNKSKAKFKWVEPYDDIIIAEFFNHLNLDINAAMEIVRHRLSFTNNKKHYLVIDASNVSNMTSEAKKYLQMPEHGLKNILGAAVVASSPLSALIANIFVKTPSDFQSRFFSRMDDAMGWIISKKKRESAVD